MAKKDDKTNVMRILAQAKINYTAHSYGDGKTALSPEEIMRMDWLCDNVDGSIPGFDELLPRSQGLVRLLGLYRESLAPQKQEKQL